PISITSSNPGSVTRTVSAPRRSKRAFVAAVVPWRRAAAIERETSRRTPSRTPSLWSGVVATFATEIEPSRKETQSVKVPPTSTATTPVTLVIAGDRTALGATLEPMPVSAEPTPNPNAMKLTVGQPVGGPATYTSAADADDPTAAELLRIEGVVSVFMTADFVTLTKSPDSDWDSITPRATQILEGRFG